MCSLFKRRKSTSLNVTNSIAVIGIKEALLIGIVPSINVLWLKFNVLGILSSESDPDAEENDKKEQNVRFHDEPYKKSPEEDKTLASELSSLSTDSSSQDLLMLTKTFSLKPSQSRVPLLQSDKHS